MKKADSYQRYLAGLICENQYFAEMQVTDESLKAMIVQFASLSDEIDQLEMELKGKKSKYKEIEDHIRPILEELHETKDKALQVDRIIVTIKRAGYERESIPYKEIYEHLFERVNASMKRIVTEVKEGLTKMVRVSSSVGVQKLEHGIMSGLYGWVARMWSRILSMVGIENEKIADAIADFEASV